MRKDFEIEQFSNKTLEPLIAYKVKGNISGRHKSVSVCCFKNLRVNTSYSAWLFTLLYVFAGLAYTAYGITKLGEIENVNRMFINFEYDTEKGYEPPTKSDF